MNVEQAHKGDVTCTDVQNALTNAQTLLTKYVEHIRNCLPLAEAEKPEWKDGDYGLAIQKRGADSGVRSFIFVGGSIYYNTRTYDEESVLSDRNYYDYVRLGNIFDDLKELLKPLYYFKADVHEYKFEPNFAQVPIQIAGNWCTLEEAKEICMKIRRLLHTAEQAKNKD